MLPVFGKIKTGPVVPGREITSDTLCGTVVPGTYYDSVELNDLFDPDYTGSVNELLDAVIEEIDAGYSPVPVKLAYEGARWHVMSALQKSVRRSMPEQAHLAASALWNSGAGSLLLNRLCVISLEDLGLSGVLPLALALRLKSRSSVTFSQAAGVVRMMCLSPKDRSVCDLLCLSMFKSARYEASDVDLALDPANAHAIMTDNRQPLVARLHAHRRIKGSLTQTNCVFDDMKLPPILCYAALGYKGLKKDEMWLALPVVWSAASLTSKFTVVPAGVGELDLLHGLPINALDMYTSDGKRAFSYFRKSCQLVGDFFSADDKLDFMSTMGLAVFITEGSVLNPQLQFDGKDDLSLASLIDEFGTVGLDKDRAIEICTIVEQSIELLNKARSVVCKKSPLVPA